MLVAAGNGRRPLAALWAIFVMVSWRRPRSPIWRFSNGSASIGLPFALHYNSGAPRSADGRSRYGATQGLRCGSSLIGGEKPATTEICPPAWIPTRSSKPLRDAGPAALRQRPFDLPTADCRSKGLSVMESQISKVYAPSNATGRQLTITKIAHNAERF